MAMSAFLWVQASALCLILTAFGLTGTILVEAEIYCYACNSYLSECGQRVDNSRGTLFRSRCSGRCFTRQGEDNAIYRGCFDGFDDVPTLVDTYNGCRNQTWNNRLLLWCICDTNLCNGEDFETMSRSHQQTQLVAASRQGQGQSAPSAHQPQRFVSVVHNHDQSELSGAAIDYRYQQPRATRPQSHQQSRPSTANNEATSVHGSTYTDTRQTSNIVTDTAHQQNTERDRTSSSGRSETSSGGSGTAAAGGLRGEASTQVKHVDRKSGKSGSSSSQGHDQGGGHGELVEYDMKGWRVEPLYDLPAALLDQGPYIWTPDDRPPHIVERITNDYQRQHDYNNNNNNDINDYLKSNHVQLHDDHDTDGYRYIGSNFKANDVITQQNDDDDDDDYYIGNNYIIYEQQQASPLLPREAYQPSNYRQTAVFDDPGRAWWANSVQNIVKQTNGGLPSSNDVTDWESESSTTEWKRQPEENRVSPSAKKSKDLDPGIVDLNGRFVDPSSVGGKSTSASNEIVKASDKSSKPEPVKSHFNDVNSNELKQTQDEDNSIMDQARCTSDAGYHLHPSDCRLYYVCIIHHNGLVPIIMRCPLGLLWDDRQKLCVLHSTTCTMPSLPDVTSSPEEANRQDSPWRSGREPGGQKSSRQIEFLYSW